MSVQVAQQAVMTMMINFFWWSVCSLRVINIIFNNFSTIIIIKFNFLYSLKLDGFITIFP